MQIGMYGLGRMGGNMARRLARHGHAPLVWNITPEPFAALSREGAVVARSIEDLVARLAPPRSRDETTFARKLLSALRHAFGGHAAAPPAAPDRAP